MVQINNTSEVRLSYTLYNSSSLFVQTSQGAAGPFQGAAGPSHDAVGTRVIGGRIAGRRVKNLPEPVIITFAPLQNFLPEDVKGVRCVFWDFEAEAGQGAWSTEGCESTGEENGLYTCACNHLTNFAAIFDVLGAGFGEHERPLEVITIVGCVVSIVCLVLTLLSFIVTRNYKRRASTGHARNQRLVLINLCVALLAILVIFLAGINQTASPIGCTVVAALLHYFLLAALVWMAVEAVNIYLAVVVVFDHHVSENFVIRAAAVAWGFPLVATVLTVGPSSLYQYRMKNNCWLAQTPLIYAFLLPAGLILLFNLMVFVIVMCKLVRDERELKQLRGAKVQEADRYWITRQIRRAFSIMALFGLTWLFGFFVITDARAVFAYLFCLFNTLQGLFIFIFHCVMREDMKKWWRKLRDMAAPCSYRGEKKRGLYDVSGRRTSLSSTVQTSQTTLVRLSSLSYNSPPDGEPM
ncbi:adhesion G protein-coupled receptor L3-like [Branchiostoma floridae]|uniref:Adhesion G protein-coupled receptor L3-like n=1 Tax=Branchiostoma floridae TaxID=7739 RepID=A0A9J7KD32_BRAFL|nr:adhesion G protein-coupled receptor L3-like [Branchiostoma floridae]